MRRYITPWLLTMSLLFGVVCVGCAPKIEPYGLDETVRLEAGDAAPFDGWLLSDRDLEFLLKRAEPVEP